MSCSPLHQTALPAGVPPLSASVLEGEVCTRKEHCTLHCVTPATTLVSSAGVRGAPPCSKADLASRRACRLGQACWRGRMQEEAGTAPH